MAADGRRPLGRWLGGGALGLALLLVAVQPALAHGGGMMGGGYGGGGFGLGFLWPLLLLGGLVALVYWLVGDGGRTVREVAGGDRALDSLRERYARGEITEEEFEQRRQRLER